MIARMTLMLFVVGCGGEVGLKGEQANVEICNNWQDDDGNGLVDCSDPVCASATCAEACGDGIDNNLDGLIDCEDFTCDGHCPEICSDDRDNDGDGDIDCFDAECADTCDVDGDGSFNIDVGGDDCDDFNGDLYPGAPEVCDGLDNDCDDLVDHEDPDLDLQSQLPWYIDNDLDGYGATGQPPEVACTAPSGYVDNDDDCWDLDAAINPTAIEVCSGFDDDCDGLTDDMDPTLDIATAELWFADSDRDGLGDPLVTVLACVPPLDFTDNDEDCDDTSDVVLGPSMWVLDADGDGFGDGIPVGPVSCTPPGPGYGPENVADCDDTDPAVFPGAVEACGDGLDSDCDGLDCDLWDDDFESGALVDWTLGGNTAWFVQGTTTHSGSYAAESGNINDNQESHLSIVVDFDQGGNVSFWHAGDTENNYDFLRFYIDGALQFEQSGSWSWTFANHAVGPGQHELFWTYYKDFSVSVGADAVVIDDIVTTGVLP